MCALPCVSRWPERSPLAPASPQTPRSPRRPGRLLTDEPLGPWSTEAARRWPCPLPNTITTQLTLSPGTVLVSHIHTQTQWGFFLTATARWILKDGLDVPNRKRFSSLQSLTLLSVKRHVAMRETQIQPLPNILVIFQRSTPGLLDLYSPTCRPPGGPSTWWRGGRRFLPLPRPEDRRSGPGMAARESPWIHTRTPRGSPTLCEDPEETGR